MTSFKKISLVLSFCLIKFYLISQTELELVSLGSLETTSGQVIKDCKIGYRTMGELNEDHSNILVWPTWFAGTSEEISGIVDMLIFSEGKYIIMIDALGNGVSSSPSNTSNFPSLSIRDMVNAQYKLLTEHLHFEHIHAIFGVSMGGMQALEWSVAYPGYMDKVVSVIGTPKQSSFDLMVWQTAADILTLSCADTLSYRFYHLAQHIVFMQEYTPGYLASTVSEEKLDQYLISRYEKELAPEDYLSQIKAMIGHDIYKSSGSTLDDIEHRIIAQTFMVVAIYDHLVNPLSSFQLQEALDAKLLKLEGECGHIAPLCEAEKVKKAIEIFLKEKR